MAKRKRDVPVLFWVSAEELEIIHQKMQQYGTENLSAYLRKMALDGYVVKLDLPELKELVSLMRRSSNNLNQLTRKVHETGRVYDADLEDISQRQEQLWEGVKEIPVSYTHLDVYKRQVKQWIIQRFCRLACRSFCRLACRSFCLRGRNVAEYQLGQLVSFAIPPDLHDVVHALIDLCAGFVRQHLVDDPLVQPQLAAIRGNLEHIVLGWVNCSAVYQRCALRKGLDHFLLMFGRLRCV